MASRGRGGRLAVYGICGIIFILLLLLYRAATTEMTRLKELHEQCTHQQEALEAQLRVIFEYKIRLEKTLSEEKSSNAAVKQELQERASREKSLRDKNSVEAMQRFNSLQQQHKILQSENQDLKDECDKRQKQALENSSKLEVTLQQLRNRINKMQDDNSIDELKTKYNNLNLEKTKIESKYYELLNNNSVNEATIKNFTKKISKLEQQLDEAKISCKATPSGSNFLKPQSSTTSTTTAATKSTTLSTGFKMAQTASSLSSPQLQHQKNYTNKMKMSTVKSSTKSSNNLTSTSIDKLSNSGVSSKTRVKLPVGVVPIPKNFLPNIDKEESSKVKIERSLPVNKKNDNLMNFEKVKNSEIIEKNIEGQNNFPWYKVKPGVQEVGDEPHNIKKLSEFDDTEIRHGQDDRYDNYYYYKEPQQKHRAIHRDEGEEEEGEDVEDYQNNLGNDKHE